MTVVVAVLTVAVVLLTVLVAGLLRSHAEILRRLHALGAGLEPDGTATGAPVSPPARRPTVASDAPDLAGADPTGDALSLTFAGARTRTLLAFLSSGCTTCAAFWESFADPDALGLPPDLRLVVVTGGPELESPTAIGALAARATVVMSSAAWADFAVPGAPYFVHVADGRIDGEGTGTSWEQVRRLLGEATGDAALAGGRSGARPEDAPAAPGARDEREARIDRALLAAGIRPGDPSLFHDGPAEAAE